MLNSFKAYIQDCEAYVKLCQISFNMRLFHLSLIIRDKLKASEEIFNMENGHSVEGNHDEFCFMRFIYDGKKYIVHVRELH